MDGVYGGRWLCVAGRTFSSDLTPGVQRFALFRTPAFAVTVFQLPKVLVPADPELMNFDLPPLERMPPLKSWVRSE